MREYLTDFFVWWYAVYSRSWLLKAVTWAVFVLNYTNTLPMAQNLFRPLFQDSSGIGRVVSFVIRLVWVWWGGMICIFVIAPYFAFVGLIYLAPLIFLAQSILGLSRLIL